MGLVSNTTPRPPNIRTDPRNTTRISCIGPGKRFVWDKIILVDDNITAPIAIPKPYMKPKLHTAPIWPQRNVRYVMVRNFSDYKIKSDYRTGLNK
ncbi:hypothetical protein IEQ34_023340 [Dendrobium chrysotoxum]|uniref:Uncharacterized protein n=1 Tax=Dendrobium chrysotoxum TaxID=161865 RepID=A0AAV7FWD4_DENCH|nr:hypothetical protein IEQ34_025777 [Dendrobium chrysotoxum]KAH0439899.1 hypothetical protein IEQ34_025779 [Dendrobium chrysotoxum]KAH0440363.1 hypothetical protein IEQ34_025605 [Dendrobium chrysotoxum]KAH0445440.1 hypothetical protein IEQ34_025481 [Dendrobium chrysotoxum]KAH0445505.1 hypothetical protein IEQ34_025408 [Dendrobium chrysotoxum]